jgi:hypothetical protein
MTSQQKADLALRQWQSLRELPPEDRIAELMASYFLPPPDSDFEYELALRNVSREMEDINVVHI